MHFPFSDLTLVYAYIQFHFCPVYHQNLYFGDPRLFVKVTQAPNKVLREFNIIVRYIVWLRKIDQVFDSDWYRVYRCFIPQELLYGNFHKEIESKVGINPPHSD